MDVTYWILGGVLLFSMLIAVVGFWRMFQRQEHDEAIDAIVSLARRQLQVYVRQQKRSL